MSQQVDSILQQIENLDEADRLTLEQRLLQRVESEWHREVEEVRAAARQQGISQQTIDEAVDGLRYGS